MAKGHALSGLAVGLAAGNLLGWGLTETVLGGLMTSAYALFSDLDHQKATITRLLGYPGKWLSQALRALSSWTYAHTRGPQDTDRAGTHRHLSHTVVFALVLGGIVLLLGLWQPWSLLVVVTIGAFASSAVLGDWALWVVVLTSGPLVVTIAHGGYADLRSASWQLAVSVSLGCVTHSAGDALTVSGSPLLWPLPIAGETWYEIKLLGPLAFSTGKTAETLLVTPLLVGLSVWLTWVTAEPHIDPLLQRFTETAPLW